MQALGPVPAEEDYAYRVRTRHDQDREEDGGAELETGFEARAQHHRDMHEYRHREEGGHRAQGRYSEALDELDPGGKRLSGEGLVLEAAAGGGSYRAWLPTPTGVLFGISGRGGKWVTWRYQGAGPPPDDRNDADAWRLESEAFHQDW